MAKRKIYEISKREDPEAKKIYLTKDEVQLLLSPIKIVIVHEKFFYNAVRDYNLFRLKVFKKPNSNNNVKILNTTEGFDFIN